MRISMFLVLFLLTAIITALADQPDLSYSFATTTATAPVSVYSLPGQGGDPLTGCYLYGGSRTDATITVTVLDIVGNPIAFHPAEDIWLEAWGTSLCPTGSIADHDTGPDGTTTITGLVGFGGAVDPSGASGRSSSSAVLPCASLASTSGSTARTSMATSW